MSSSSSAPPTGSRGKQLVLNLAPGFHFLPEDHELVLHYLRPRLFNPHCKLPLPIFIRERILDYHPQELTEKYRKYGEGRWFFFTVRERKHSSGCRRRPNRTTKDNGHWNATGSIKPIRRSGGVLVGCRRTLVFYEASRSRKKKGQATAGLQAATEEGEEEEGGQATKAKDDGVKTDWTMYEYESVSSAEEFEAIRNGNVNLDVVVLCTIQKKKHSQEDGHHETKKSTKRKTKEEEGQKAAGDVDVDFEQGTTEGQDDEDDALEEAAAAELLPELASYYDVAPAGVGSSNVDPNQSMPYYQYHFTNSLSAVPTPPQETVMATGREDNHHDVMLQQNYYYYYFINQSMNMKNSQSFHAQATLPQEFLPYYSDTTMAAAPRGGTNTMDGMLQNSMLVSMTPSQLAPPVMPGTGTYLSPRRSNLDAWESTSAVLPADEPKMPLNSEDAWLQAGRQLNSSYVTNSSSLVPTPDLQETTMAMLAHAAGGHNYHAAMHQQNYFNHSMNVRDSEFHVMQAALTQEEFLPSSSSSSTQMAGGTVVDHHMLQNRIFDMGPAAAEAHAFNGYGYGPVLSSSNYGQGGVEYDHLSTKMDHPPDHEPSRFSFSSSQQSQGPVLLNNQVNLLNNQNPTAFVVGYDRRKGVGLPPKTLKIN